MILDDSLLADPLVVWMHSTTCSASVSESHICLLVNLRVVGVEGLRVIIIKCSWLSVVFFHSHYHAANFTVWKNISLLLNSFNQINSWHISVAFFPGLWSIFLCLDTEWVLGLVSWMETPISLFSFSLFPFLFISSLEIILPGYSSAKIIPVEVSVHGNKEEERPENPSHFTDHPDIGLAHIIGDVEHHCIQYN